jgi:hypothetical protein
MILQLKNKLLKNGSCMHGRDIFVLRRLILSIYACQNLHTTDTKSHARATKFVCNEMD